MSQPALRRSALLALAMTLLATRSATAGSTVGSCERIDCATAPANVVTLRTRGRSASLAWSWRQAAPMDLLQLGDPRLPGGTRYALCVRDGAGVLVFRAELPTCAGGAGCWRTTPARGLRFRGAGAGVRALAITYDGPNGASIVASARGRDLITTTLPPALPLVVQLEADTGACWTAAFHAPDVATSGAGRFKAETR